MYSAHTFEVEEMKLHRNCIATSEVMGLEFLQPLITIFSLQSDKSQLHWLDNLHVKQKNPVNTRRPVNWMCVCCVARVGWGRGGGRDQ